MTTERPRTAWPCRASLFVSRTFGLAAALGVALIGVFLLFRGGEVLWGIAAIPVSIWVGFQGAPMLLRALERMGAFGRVRIEAGVLRVGRAPGIELNDSFEVDARRQSSRIQRTYNLKDLGITSTKRLRTHTLQILALSVVVGQEGRRYQYVGDETNRAPGPDYVTEGLAVRQLPIVRAKARQVRVWGADLAQVLGRLRESAGYSSPALPEQPEPLQDPRKAFCPTWKVVVGTIAIVAAFLVGSYTAYQGYTERHAAEWDVRHAASERQREEQEALGAELVGQRVRVRAQGGARIVGTIESYKVMSSYGMESETVWRAYVNVRIEELLDADGNVLPDGAEVTYMSGDNYVKKGEAVEDRASEVEMLQAEAPTSD